MSCPEGAAAASPLHLKTCRNGGHDLSAAQCLCGTRAPQQTVSSFNHIISELLEAKRYFDAQRLSGLEVYHQLKLDRLMYWEVSRFRTAENFSGVGSYLLI
jgi:hypothetical protein